LSVKSTEVPRLDDQASELPAAGVQQNSHLFREVLLLAEGQLDGLDLADVLQDNLVPSVARLLVEEGPCEPDQRVLALDRLQLDVVQEQVDPRDEGNEELHQGYQLIEPGEA